MIAPQYRRPGTCWYVSDGYIWDNHAIQHRREGGRPLECSSKLFVYNPQTTTAHVTVRCYHEDRPPTAYPLTVMPEAIASLELAALQQVPHRQAFWIAIESDVPVLPQARHEDYTFWDPVPDAMVCVAPYPGPLEDETSWVFPDCFQGGNGSSWFERESITILNPGTEAVQVQVRYLFGAQSIGGEEWITIPGERVAALHGWERYPRLLGDPGGPAVRLQAEYAVRIDASGPVVAQTTRRARWTDFEPIIGSRSTIASPIREAPACWYYPGGDIVDYGILPRSVSEEHPPYDECDNTWNLLFVNNLDAEKPAHPTVTFNKPDGSSSQAPLAAVRPLVSRLEWLEARPWLGTHTRVDEPFAMTVTADLPVVPSVCGAEFEMWSQVCPGAMIAVNFYPGPLEGETTWWLGIGHAGGRNDMNVEWRRTYYLFNPGEDAVNITLSFHGGDRPLTHPISLPPGGVTRIRANEIAGLPSDKPFAVKAAGDAPFVAQVYGRAFTRGLPHVRAMYSFIGVPMALKS